ncbi:MAG: endonuclease/exonuclease/phosphatase family protein [Planctomycetota bacterium]|jgi:endonuclease/exonuclease/phosphatase family metal-dependent hydrolase
MKPDCHLIRALGFLALVPFLFLSCAQPPVGEDAQPESNRLRVLTYNIHHGEGMDGAFVYDRLAEAIGRANPDLVALQEVDRRTRRAAGVDQAAALGEMLGMIHAFGEAMPFSGGLYGEAVLSRYPFAGIYNTALSCSPGQEPRAALLVQVRPWGDEGPILLFVGTHLCHQSEETRLRQVKEILIALSEWGGPAVLAGDFNFAPDSEPYVLLSETWDDAARIFGREEPTFGAHFAPEERDARIDYVWVRKGWGLKVKDVEVMEEPLASDHLPLLVVLEYEPPEQKVQ